MGSCTVLVVCCGAWSVSYPQPPWRARHRCTVGVLTGTHPCDAPIRERQSASSCVRACGLRVSLRTWSRIQVERLWCSAVRHPFDAQTFTSRNQTSSDLSIMRDTLRSMFFHKRQQARKKSLLSLAGAHGLKLDSATGGVCCTNKSWTLYKRAHTTRRSPRKSRRRRVQHEFSSSQECRVDSGASLQITGSTLCHS